MLIKKTLLNELEQDKSIKVAWFSQIIYLLIQNIYQQFGNRIYVKAKREEIISQCKSTVSIIFRLFRSLIQEIWRNSNSNKCKKTLRKVDCLFLVFSFFVTRNYCIYRLASVLILTWLHLLKGNLNGLPVADGCWSSVVLAFFSLA